MSAGKNTFQLLMLQGEIAALLHDIGKFTEEFIGGNYRDHCRTFVEKLCIPELRDVLQAEVPASCFSSLGKTKLKSLSDLIRWHHIFEEIASYFGSDAQDGVHLPLELYLLIYADTLDSASSKGGANFRPPKGRPSRLDRSPSAQNQSTLYLATPFGEQEKVLQCNGFAAKSQDFQRQLAAILKEFSKICGDHVQLGEFRARLMNVLEAHFSAALAETRIPNNDVSLWQHSYSTASIFKAMLAGHLLTDDAEYCDANGDYILYKEKLAIIGICWSEDQLIGRSFRPAEILGRRLRLDTCVDKLKQNLETVHCLGNEIYRDRDGIYFLIPALSRDHENDRRIESALNNFLDEIGSVMNDSQGLGGELEWQARYLEVGQQISRLAEVVAGENEEVHLLADGPSQPHWVKEWQGKEGQEVCPRCGCRPVDLRPVVSGSEGDDTAGGVCSRCIQYAFDGGKFRRDAAYPPANRQAQRLLATDGSSQYLRFDLESFFNQEDDNDRSRRFALVQGLVDLRPMLSGRAFSSILAIRPEWFSRPRGKNDQSSDVMNDWASLLAGTQSAWDELRTGNGSVNEPSRHTMQQLFQDTYLCTDQDGRACGKDGDDKARNYLRDTVLTAPFAQEMQEEHEKLVNYALRQHPAPSRLARVWHTTLAFSRFPIAWCEQEKIPYTTITLDPGRFMLLVAADQAWKLTHAIHEEYSRCFSRVRHLLPLHLSATVFYHKAPLYIGIDAARRFARLGLEISGTAEWWKLLSPPQNDNVETQLCLQDPFGHQTIWRLPCKLPNGELDQHYRWYWKKGDPSHPFPVEDLSSGDEISVFPSTFDYEILDSTTRRYDIRPLHGEMRQRPHNFKRHGGPRPYSLATLEAWLRVDRPLRLAEPSQRKGLIELLARIHREWNGPDTDTASRHIVDLRNLAEDAIKIALGQNALTHHGKELLQMACDGSLFDLVEWQEYIDR